MAEVTTDPVRLPPGPRIPKLLQGLIMLTARHQATVFFFWWLALRGLTPPGGGGLWVPPLYGCDLGAIFRGLGLICRGSELICVVLDLCFGVLNL